MENRNAELELNALEPLIRLYATGTAESHRTDLLRDLRERLARTEDPELRTRIASAIKRASGGLEEEDLEPTSPKPEGKL
ncbi:MAG: hypothetical protein ACLP66_14835 [Polyangia bacterium]